MMLSAMVFKGQAAEGDTTKVRFHNKKDLTWYGNYDHKSAFPAKGKTWNRILLKYTMGCSSTGCSGWDYTTHVQYLKNTGKLDSNIAKIDTLSGDTSWNVYEIKEPFELGRVITPYGTYMRDGTNGFNNNWQQVYWFDVTDFEPLLHDSATIRVFYSGWQNGFSATIDFFFIEGTPARKVLQYQNLWGNGGGSAGYPDSKTFESGFMSARKIYHVPNAPSARLTFTPTGHGFDNDKYAAEFYPELFALKINGDTIGTDYIWNDKCGENPIYPQGGTWVYNRANWCPGGAAGIFSWEIGNKLKADSNELDIDFEPFTWSGNQTPSYTVSAMLFQYDTFHYIHEASLEDIIAPSDDPNYMRFNPMCDQPIISIKNNGKDTLRSLKITYGFAGQTPANYTWNGALAFGAGTRISLPLLDFTGVQQNSTFQCSISEPNGSVDELNYNNQKSSKALLTPKLENKIVVWFKTNRAGAENSYKFTDQFGNTIFEKKGFMNDTVMLYKDTINLPNGCINLTLVDSGGDGIDWWANRSAVKSGYFWLRNFSSTVWIRMNPDFGAVMNYRFNANFGMPVEQVFETAEWFQIFPNPAQHLLNIESFDPNFRGEWVLTDLSGKTVSRGNMSNSVNIQTDLMASGLYILTINGGESQFIKKVYIQH